jgi:hypothetical protein
VRVLDIAARLRFANHSATRSPERHGRRICKP